MSNGFDFNHDGKVDMQDVHLYEDIFSDESGNSRQTYKPSSGGHISDGSIIGGILALSYLSSLLNGTIGANWFTLILGIISIVVLVACLLSGK
jgi:hypothetical protein